MKGGEEEQKVHSLHTLLQCFHFDAVSKTPPIQRFTGLTRSLLKTQEPFRPLTNLRREVFHHPILQMKLRLRGQITFRSACMQQDAKLNPT